MNRGQIHSAVRVHHQPLGQCLAHVDGSLDLILIDTQHLCQSQAPGQCCGSPLQAAPYSGHYALRVIVGVGVFGPG